MSEYIAYASGKIVTCALCGTVIQAKDQRYWLRGTDRYYCAKCATKAQIQAKERKESENILDDAREIGEIYLALEKQTKASPEALASLACTVFISRRQRT